MPRPRTKDKHLPRRVYLRHGSYYFVDAAGKWKRLGKTPADMYRGLADLVDVGPVQTIGDLIDRYVREVLPSYRAKEQQGRLPHLTRIRAAAGAMAPHDLTGAHVRQLRDRIGQRKGQEWGRPQLALKALMVLSHLFSWACEWGIVEVNPCRGVKRPPQPRRKRYPTDAEFAAVYKRCPPMIQVAMDLALLTGLRREDILRIDRDACTDDGLTVATGKTGAALTFNWTAELKAAVDRGWSMPPRVRRHLVCTRHGKRYTGDGFSTVWKRARKAALEAGEIETAFRFNDIRAKSASDDTSIQRASDRLGHTTRAVTERHYIRTPKKVEPLR